MKRVKVKYSALHSSLINLPLSVYGPLVSAGVRPQAVAVHLSNAKKNDDLRAGFVGWTGLSSATSAARWSGSRAVDGDLETVEMDPQLCNCLGFVENDVLELGLVHNLPVARVVNVEPISSDDWEILELHAQFVEDNLLSQVRVVAKDQKINVWVLGKTLIRFSVLSMDPDKTPQLLSTDTELVIAPKSRKKAQDIQTSTAVKGNSETRGALLRLIPSWIASATIPAEGEPVSSAYVSETTMAKLGMTDGRRVYLERLSVPIQSQVKEVKHLQWPTSEDSPKKVALKRLQDAASGKNDQPSIPDEGKTVPYIVIKLSKTMPDNHVGVTNYLDARPWDVVRLSSESFDQVEGGNSWSNKPINLFQIPSETNRRQIVGQDARMEECTRFIHSVFLARRTTPKTILKGPKVLVSGGRGVGKTSLAIEVARRLEKERELCPFYVDMGRFCEETLTGHKALFAVLTKLAIWHAPSIVILDNIHHLVGAETEHTDTFKSKQIAELFVKFLSKLTESLVGILAIAENMASLHKTLNAGHSFSKIVSIPPPNKDIRVEILRRLVEGLPDGAKRDSGSLNYIAVATKTEGYSPQDLFDLTNRALHKATIRMAGHLDGDVCLQMKDFDAAQEGYTPLSVRDIKLQRSEIEWTDIGGLHETRRILRETLEWPTKYAAIFAKCPLRLRSGLLLYGYPGCGKTMLASAVSKECGLNFISVKGPELLNKYIGASEKSVRELFERASAAKPCVLFFDEFDSIAPRRGHDSTGVTDRVVNQMLTQMDGAEGLDGVYVLAATSRPDLIDPALLRPGRLDKSLLCHMPTSEERLEILEAVTRKMKLEPNVNLRLLVENAEGFSGADLQALIYNAHLESVHEVLTVAPTRQDQNDVIQQRQYIVLGEGAGQVQSKAEKAATKARLDTILRAGTKQKATQSQPSRKPVISQIHLEKALASMKPSVPDSERRRLDAIYRHFSSDRQSTLERTVEGNPLAVGNRASLM